MMESIIDYTQATEYSVWVDGGVNPRKDIYPIYKAGRDPIKPEHLAACKAFLITDWGAKISDGVETDDEIIMEHTQDPEKVIICSNDKDFRANAAGYHYNFTLAEENRVIDYVTHGERDYNFMIQMLMGDRVDNINGPFGHTAKVTVSKYLENMAIAGIIEPEHVTIEAYKTKWGDEWEKWYMLNYRLLRLIRSREELVQIDNEQKTNQYPIWESEGKEPTEEGSTENIGEPQ